MKTRFLSKLFQLAAAITAVNLIGGAPITQAQSWHLTGNGGTDPSTNFLGTTDAQPLVIQTNRAARGPVADLRVGTNGNVAIGTFPFGTLERLNVAGNIFLSQSGSDSGLRLQYGVGNSFWISSPNENLMAIGGTGNGPPSGGAINVTSAGDVGIGTTSPGGVFEVHGTSAKAGVLGIAPNVAIYARNTESGKEAYLGTRNGAGEFHGDVAVLGKTTTQVLEITGGSDLAEPFALAEEAIEPGMVVTIDPVHPGQLRRAGHAYDRAVAGVVSGANGIKPGLTMTSSTAAEHSRPVALTGRVYVLADATHDAIQPGDLLTTADIPGHAMKVTDYSRAQGAIIGKAMSALPAGKGLVLVLVSLQ